MRLPPALALLFFPALAAAQGAPASARADSIRASIRAYRVANERAIVGELFDLLAIPNLATDSVNIRRNASALVTMLGRRGFATRLLEVAGAPPAVYGELAAPGATRTIVFYAHYDGQPVDATQWTSPPWTPTPRTVNGEERVFARSASDDKSPIVAMLVAIDALRAAGRAPSVNLKVFLDGEEEMGSGHLDQILAANRELLRADLWVIADGPVHQTRRPQVVFGARGVMGAELTTYGPSRALHSGHYGNWAPNPIVRLANLIASMRDDDGRIRIAGWYDDVAPIGAAERRAIATAPKIDSSLRAGLSLARTEASNAVLVERVMLPALNLRGIRGGNVGELAANAIPVSAQASIDFRLVPGQRTGRLQRLFEAHVRARGYHVVHAEPSPEERGRYAKILRIDWESGYPAAFTPMSSAPAVAVARAADLAIGAPVVRMPLMGGSVPLSGIQTVLGTPFVILPMVNHDNNQHAANENLRLQNLWDGIELYGGFFAALGGEWPR